MCLDNSIDMMALVVNSISLRFLRPLFEKKGYVTVWCQLYSTVTIYVYIKFNHVYCLGVESINTSGSNCVVCILITVFAQLEVGRCPLYWADGFIACSFRISVNFAFAMYLSWKSHNVPIPYPIIIHFVTEMCTCVHMSVIKWCTVGYFSNAWWDLGNGSMALSSC